MSEQIVPPTATLTMQRFVRACGHNETMMWTVGDEAQAEHYRSTGCSMCRTPVITFATGWGRTR